MPDDERARLEEIKPPEDLKPVVAEDLPPLFRRRFEENNGVVGTVFYVKFDNRLSLSDGHIALRIAKTTDNVKLSDGTVIQTASHSTIFAEMIRSMQRDGPLASVASFAAVACVVLIATASLRGAASVLTVLLLGVLWLLGFTALSGIKLNYVNFIALPITFGIGTEYPFNVFDRSRLLGGDTTLALRRTGGAVALCSFTTIVGYGSLLFNDFQALQTFGKLAMFGELACVGCAMFLLPSILHLWGYKRTAGAPVADEHAGGTHAPPPGRSPGAQPEARSAE
jgi:predicted RND superfamily exporter protein